MYAFFMSFVPDLQDHLLENYMFPELVKSQETEVCLSRTLQAIDDVAAPFDHVRR
jgi:hypothetical protein